MTIAGWIMLVLSWGLIIALNIFCLVRMFARKENGSENNRTSSG